MKSYYRRFSIVFPKELLNQIRRRATVRGKRLNSEIEWFLRLAIEALGDSEGEVRRFEGETVRTTFYLPDDLLATVEARGDMFGYRTGPELCRLVQIAMEMVVQRELAIISDMAALDRARRALPETAAAE